MIVFMMMVRLVCRSILPENLHFDKDLNIKLTHFRTAVDLTSDSLPTQTELTQPVSVVDYMAPEASCPCPCSEQRCRVAVLS